MGDKGLSISPESTSRVEKMRNSSVNITLGRRGNKEGGVDFQCSEQLERETGGLDFEGLCGDRMCSVCVL